MPVEIAHRLLAVGISRLGNHALRAASSVFAQQPVLKQLLRGRPNDGERHPGPLGNVEKRVTAI
jgi:hypothetical protein